MEKVTLKHITIILSGVIFFLGIAVVAGLIFLSGKTLNVHTTWQDYQSEYSEKVRLKGALEQSLGYGGMIHNFKNLIIRKEPAQFQVVDNNITAAEQILDQYSLLVIGAGEQAAIDDIQLILRRYRESLNKARKAIEEELNAREIDEIVRVDDSFALRGLSTLKQVNITQKNTLSTGLSKAQHLSNLRSSLGYGGMVHSFKNYLLRREARYADVAENSLRKALDAIKQYRQRGLLNSEEIALNDIEVTIQQYQENLIKMRIAIEQGLSVEEIDQIVRIDDGLALRGLNILVRETNSQILSHEKEVTESLQYMQLIQKIMIVGLLSLTLLTIWLLIWLINYRIRLPFSRMINVMNQLSQGNTSIEISAIPGNNELARMAHALQIFREEMLRREASDMAVTKANEVLNQQLEELKETRRQSDEQAKKALMLAERLGQARDEALLATREAEFEKRRAEAVVDTVSDGIITINERGTILSFNPAAEGIFGYRSSEVINKNISMMMPEPYSSSHDGYLKNYIKTDFGKILGSKNSMAGRRELVGLRKDNSIFDLELSIGVSVTDDERMFTGVVRDISQQKRLESMKHEFISTVSHELRTPLTAIKGSLGLLSSDVLGINLEGESKRMMDITIRNVDRLTELVNDILDFEKLEAGKIIMYPTVMPVDEILNDAAEVNAHYGVMNDVSFEIDKSLDAKVMADATRIAQVMANFMSNAAKFSPNGAVVKIGATRLNGWIRFSVADTGCGIPEIFHDHIFDRFTQADSSDVRQQGGTGLGMAISRTIIAHHNGRIGFDSIEGKGSTFYFDLREIEV